MGEWHRLAACTVPDHDMSGNGAMGNAKDPADLTDLCNGKSLKLRLSTASGNVCSGGTLKSRGSIDSDMERNRSSMDSGQPRFPISLGLSDSF